VRLPEVTVLSAPDAEGYWSVSDASGTATLFGVDTYDPSLNEDPDGPTPGDVYKIYGALRQVAAGYQLDVGDIDTLSLATGIVALSMSTLQVKAYPNPAASKLTIEAGQPFSWRLLDARGALIDQGHSQGQAEISAAQWPAGTYTLLTTTSGPNASTARQPIYVVH
jgi:hypothetical protein